MTRVVWKYEVPAYVNDVRMPEGAEIVAVHAQFGEVCIWALVDRDARPVHRTFTVVGTGHAMIGDSDTYVGTAHLSDSIVLHVFERIA